MADNTAIGPANAPPVKDGSGRPKATSEGVDAQDANEFDMRHGLAGAEAKPFSRPSRETAKQAFSSQPENDPNRADPNARSDMIGERRNPGSHGGGGDPGWKKS